MINNIGIEHFIYFNEAAKLESISRASKSLRISGSSISSSISIIESSFQVKLFNRKGRRIYLNQDGRKLFDEVQKLLESYHSLPSTFSKNHYPIQGHYRLAGSHFIANNILPVLLSEFLTKKEDFKVDVLSMETNYLIGKIQSGEIDIGVVIGHIPNPKISETVVSSDLNIIPVVHKSHPLLMEKYWLKKIEEFPCCIHTPGMYTDRCDNHTMFTKFKLRPRFKAYWDSDDVACRLLEGGLFWTLLPDIVLKYKRDFRGLSLPKNWFAPTKISVIYESSRKHLRFFSEQVSKKLKDELNLKIN